MDMSTLNHTQLGQIDAENRIRIKQFDAPGTQPSRKKNALTDVKNTLHQKSAQQSNIPSTSIKSSIKGARVLFSGANEFSTQKKEPKQDEHLHGQTKTEAVTQNLITNDDNCVVTCKCDELLQDDVDNIFFKDLKLTNSQIEAFALDWENRPTFTVKDKRSLDFIDVKKIELDFKFGPDDAFESVLKKFPVINTPQIEVPPLFLEDDEWFMNDTNDRSSIGL